MQRVDPSKPSSPPVAQRDGAPRRLLIVGGGVAGLAAAYQAERARRDGAALEYRVIESQPVWGGRVCTERALGYLVEGGPDSFIVRKPWALELVEELGLGGEVVETPPERRHVGVLFRDRLERLPEGMLMAVPTRLGPLLKTPLLSPRGKARVLLDLLLPRGGDREETLGAFVRRRLGREALERLAEPLMAGIYAADPERLSLGASFPHFVHLERRYRSLIRGARAQRRGAAGDSPDPSARVTLRDGLGTWIDALVGALDPAALLSGREVRGLERRGDGYALHLDGGETLAADAVVLAVPSFAAAKLLDPLAPLAADPLHEVRHTTTATVSLGFHREDVGHPLDGMGFLVPRREGRRLRACTWCSSKFDGRAPADRVLLRAFVGGAGGSAVARLEAGELVQAVLDDLAGPLALTGEPELVRVHRALRGIPHYELGHRRRIAAAEAALPPGIRLAGGSYHGVGLPDCVHSGRTAVESLLAGERLDAASALEAATSA